VNLPNPIRRAAREAASEPWTRGRLIGALASARAEFVEAIAGLTPREAEKAMGLGRWNVRELVLHIVARDQARLREMEAALAGTEASWQHLTPEQQSRVNAQEVGALRAHTWEQAQQLLDASRREVQERLSQVPEEPLAVWQPSHPFGWMMEALHRHDRHHAEVIRRWRAATGI
jgi:hypothetical protein